MKYPNNSSEKISFPPELVQEYRQRKIKRQRKIVLFSVLSICLVVSLGFGVSFLFNKISSSKIAKGTIIQQEQIVAGQPVKWKMVIPKSEIENGKSVALLPKGTTGIKIKSIEAEQAKAVLSAKPKQQLSLLQRQQLAIAPSSVQSAKAGSSNAFGFLLADLGDAVENVVQTITGDTGEVQIDISNPPPVEAEAPTPPPIEDSLTPETASSTETALSAQSSADNQAGETPEEEFIAIEYVTPAPEITSELTDQGQQVVVSSAEEDPQAPLVDVLASTKIPEIFKVGQEDKIKIKWENEGNQEVAFNAYDTDNNGRLDYVEWTVPHLSEQIFEIIFISKAFKLDSDQNILEDIYDTVKTQDGTYASITNN
ncbi:MAG: hypothetical protein NT026_02425, partial [Candidatus Staskawiczbacteria bacterium]|nr:hypothetical protein [Candidatus Staskawiczbacteria bacterium]